MYGVCAREAPARWGTLRWLPDSRLGTALAVGSTRTAQERVRVRLCLDEDHRAVVRKIMCAHHRRDGGGNLGATNR
jgi:hypothetical protein